MIRLIDGRKYLMRDARPVRELRELHRQFERKYGTMDFHRWLSDRGKIHLVLTKDKP